jgi:hypothetical protein
MMATLELTLRMIAAFGVHIEIMRPHTILGPSESAKEFTSASPL